MCPEDHKPHCPMAPACQLAQAHIDDPHDFEYGYVGGSVSKYDICACDDGSTKIAGRGQCGKKGAPMIDGRDECR
jgi:hypothetical protein